MFIRLSLEGVVKRSPFFFLVQCLSSLEMLVSSKLLICFRCSNTTGLRLLLYFFDISPPFFLSLSTSVAGPVSLFFFQLVFAVFTHCMHTYLLLLLFCQTNPNQKTYLFSSPPPSPPPPFFHQPAPTDYTKKDPAFPLKGVSFFLGFFFPPYLFFFLLRTDGSPLAAGCGCAGIVGTCHCGAKCHREW